MSLFRKFTPSIAARELNDAFDEGKVHGRNTRLNFTATPRHMESPYANRQSDYGNYCSSDWYRQLQLQWQLGVEDGRAERISELKISCDDELKAA